MALSFNETLLSFKDAKLPFEYFMIDAHDSEQSGIDGGMLKRQQPLIHSESNKMLVKQFIDTLNAGDAAGVSAVVIPDFVSHFASATMNLQQFIGFNQMIKTAFADFTFVIEDSIAEEDKVAIRLFWPYKI